LVLIDFSLNATRCIFETLLSSFVRIYRPKCAPLTYSKILVGVMQGDTLAQTICELDCAAG